METREEIRDFLTTRRAGIAPEDAGLSPSGNRRVPGLRREEVAVLAGISVEYYTRLERGNAKGASDDVLDAIARALRLDEAERAHLHNLVRAQQGSAGTVRRRPARAHVRPPVQWILDAMTRAPAYLRNGRLDILAANRLGRALYSVVFDDPAADGNIARFMFLNPNAPEFFADWDNMAGDAVKILRAEAGRDPYDKRLTELVGELSTRSDEFRIRWATHDVKFHRTGTKTLHHPVVGDLTLSYEALDLPGDDGHRILAYAAEPGSPTGERLDLLASWAAPPPSPAREHSTTTVDDT